MCEEIKKYTENKKVLEGYVSHEYLPKVDHCRWCGEDESRIRVSYKRKDLIYGSEVLLQATLLPLSWVWRFDVPYCSKECLERQELCELEGVKAMDKFKEKDNLWRSKI
ncbi:MAG: hypothetical protein KDH96_01885 [Candidatus Riesia sp.]|nr:hypothetical protein [Candidatus Riesia sp.]